MVVQRQKFNFFQNMAMLHIKHHTSMHFVLTHTLDRWGKVKRSKDFFYLKVVMLHIIGRKKHTPLALGWGQEVKAVALSESSHVAYQIKGMKHRAPCKHTICPYTHPQLLWLGIKVKYLFFSESSCVAYRIKGKGT